MNAADLQEWLHRGRLWRLGNLLSDIRFYVWRLTNRCPSCGGDPTHNWFDRSLCVCGVMHTRCRTCGYPLDPCDEATEGDA